MRAGEGVSVEGLERRTMLTAVVGLLAGNEVVVFDSAAPERILARRRLRMPAGETMVGVDFAPQDGVLYGMSGSSKLYRIDPEVGDVRLVGDAQIPVEARDRLTFDLSPKTLFGYFRAVGGTGRLVGGLFSGRGSDAAVAYAPGDVNAGVGPEVVGLGHLRGPELGLDAETVYGIDAATDSLVTLGTEGGARRPPESGRLYTVGPLGLDAGELTGFDVTGQMLFRADGYASVVRGGRTVFCAVDMVTGAATEVGVVGGGVVVRDIAVSGDATVLGVTAGNEVLVFGAVTPDRILGRTAVTKGLRADEAVLSMDVRPGTGELFAVSSRDALYDVDLSTGAARAVGARFTPFFKGAPASADFDPVSGQLRVLSDRGEMLRLDADTGAVVDARPFVRGVQIDAPLHDARAGVLAEGVMTIAHDNNYPGAAGTRLFGIDRGSRLVEVSGSGDGTVTAIAALGFGIGDIASLDVVSGARGKEGAYVAVRHPGERSVRIIGITLYDGLELFEIEIASGRKAVRDIAVMTG